MTLTKLSKKRKFKSDHQLMSLFQQQQQQKNTDQLFNPFQKRSFNLQFSRTFKIRTEQQVTTNCDWKLIYKICAAHYPLFARFRHATGIVIGQLKEVFHARHISFSFSLASTRQTIQLVYKDKAASKVITNSTSDKHLFVSMQLKPSKSHNSTIKAILLWSITVQRHMYIVCRVSKAFHTVLG